MNAIRAVSFAAGFVVTVTRPDVGLGQVPEVATISLTFDQALQGITTGALPEAELRAAQGLLQAATDSPGLDAHPTVHVTGGPRLIPESQRGFEGSVGLFQSFSLAGAADTRRQSLAQEAHERLASRQATLLSRRTEAAMTWLAAHSAQAQFVAATAYAEAQCASAQHTERLLALAESVVVTTQTARALCFEARAAAEHTEGVLQELKLALARHIEHPEAHIQTVGEWPVAQAPGRTEAEVLADVGNMPEVVRAQMLARTLRLRGAEEVAARGWRVTAGLTAQQDDPNGISVIASFNTTLPVFDVAHRERASSEASAMVAETHTAETRLRAISETRLAFHEVAHWADIESERQEVLGAQLAGLHAARLLRDREELTVLEVLALEASMHLAEIAVIEAHANLIAARFRVLLICQATSREERS